MDVPSLLKKPPVIIGGVILVIIIIVLSRRGSAASGGDSYAQQLSATSAANASIAQLNAQTEQIRIQAGVQTIGLTLGAQTAQQNIDAQKIVALSKIASDENVNLQTADYQYDLANKQVEANRILGLTHEDTMRLVSTQENNTRLTLGLTALDVNRYLGERALQSEEVKQARELTYREKELASNERIADFTSSRALTYATIQGNTQVQAIKAGKPSVWAGFLGGLGGGLGKGLGSFLGGL
jgi:hypothetical protein